MHLVTVDTDVMLPGLLGSGRKRSFVFVLLLGAITARLEGITAEVVALEAMAVETGATFHRGPLQRTVSSYEDARAAVVERLPYATPDDWRLCLSQTTLDEYLRTIVEVGTQLNRDALGAGIQYWRRFIDLLVCEFIAQPFTEVPRYVPADPNDDHVVHTAILTNSEWLITTDHHLVPRGEDTQLIESPADHGGAIVAIRFEHLVAAHLNSSAFELASVDSSRMFLAANAVAQAQAGEQIGEQTEGH